MADQVTIRALVTARGAAPARGGALASSSDRAAVQLLGYEWAPGDLVRDLVTGQTGKVLHVTSRAIQRPAPDAHQG